MKTTELDNMPDEDDILLQVEHLKMGLLAKATDGDFEQSEYSRLRKIVLGIPGFPSVPRFLKICRTADDFRSYMQGEAPSYKERRLIIAEKLNPILEFVEYETGEGALEFKKLYEEKEIIGSGGFGQVYQYEHRLLKISFAVKIFAPAFYEGSEKELERFFQEARMLFKFNHPSIIKVYDAGLIGKRPFIRMEYFEGKNLNEILMEHGTLSSSQALNMMEHLVSGIKHAHEEIGIIHRDLKPSNIMAARPNQFRIIDFGMSVFIENELHSRLTKTGEATVSGYYNAPELVENPKLIDKRSDIYSLGALWYSMLTGQPPAGTELRENLIGIEGIDENYINSISSCLSNIGNRTSSCDELLNQIKELKK